MESSNLICIRCDFQVDKNSDFCPRCGKLFIENVKCENHSHIDATGVCVICRVPFCSNDGDQVNNVFLCVDHNGYEIYQGMARVFGTSDEVQIQYVKNYLEENNFHPFVYSRKSSPMHLGGTDYSLFRASGDFNGRIINEIKLMLPCGEILEAKEKLENLNL